MVRAFTIASLILFFTACTGNLPESLFEKDGVSFISPEGWRQTGEKSINQSGYYISCQRKGYGSSGIFILTWVNGQVDPKVYLKNYSAEFEKNLLMRATKVHFSEPQDTSLNGIPAIRLVYTSDILGVASQGEIFSFFMVDKTFMLVFQESVDESKKNKAGFDKIKQSFSYNPEKRLP